jgi:hypothetical protein
MADAADLKSAVLADVWVRIPPALSDGNYLEPAAIAVEQFAQMLCFPQQHILSELPRQIVEEIQDGFFVSRD